MLTAARASSSWDWMGQLLSALCLAHCVALPLLTGLLPAATAEVLEGEAVHQGLIVFVVVTAAAAFVPGFRVHRRVSVLALAGVALALLGTAAFLLPEGTSEAAETGLTLGGGALMALAHWRNRTLCRDCCGT